MRQRPIDILYVEDVKADVIIMERTLQKTRSHYTLNVVEDGEEALSYLFKKHEYVNAITPDLIFLDLNIPKIDGHEVLQRIKTDKHLKLIPVIIVTTSKDDEDVYKAYDNYANAYIRKPIKLAEFQRIIESIKDFWFNYNEYSKAL